MILSSLSNATKNILCEALEVIVLQNQSIQPSRGVITSQTPACVLWMMRSDYTLTLQFTIGNSAVVGGYLASGSVGSIVILDNSITLGQFVTVQYLF